MNQTLLTTKLIEVRSHIAYLQRICAQRQSSAYPNLRERLRLILSAFGDLDLLCATLQHELAQYRPPTNPAFDTLPQLFTKLREVANDVQAFRTHQLPAYLADSPDEATFARMVEDIHREIGIVGVYPVVALQQPGWFAVNWGLPQYPLYFLPHSVVSDPGELSLIFHEIGHVLYHLWGAEFAHVVQASLVQTYSRKRSEAQATTDPLVRTDREQSLADWINAVVNQSEELICDIVGTLLGGPAFALALAVGLFATGANPFEYAPTSIYPPLDCRMRVISIVLRDRGLHDQNVAQIEQGWLTIRALSSSTSSRFYDWLYDDVFLSDLAIAVDQFLRTKGVTLYSANPGGIREHLAQGVAARLGGTAVYDAWASAFAAMIQNDYSP